MSTRLRHWIWRGIDLLAGVAGIVVLFRLYAIYASVGLRLNHDEAEHMHVAFLIERGERPYLDFIENHPMLFNLGILTLKRIAPQDTVFELYMNARLLVLLAFVGSVFFVYRLCEDYSRRLGNRYRAGSLFLLVFFFFGLLPEAASYMWDVRPDWFCYLFSLMCVYTHYRVHAESGPSSSASRFAVLGLGGIAGGLATAILPKSIFIFVPYAFVAGVVLASLVREHAKTIARLTIANVIFCGAGIFGFGLAVAFELHTTGASLVSYYKANFVINRLAHPVDSLEDTPLSQLDAIAGIGLWPLVLVGLTSVVLLALLHRKERRFEFLTLLFALSLIGFNSILLASTNGAYWVHNFAPSLLGLVIIGFVLLHSVTNWLYSRFGGRSTSAIAMPSSSTVSVNLTWGVAFLLAVLTGISFANRLVEAIRDYGNLEFSRSFRNLSAAGEASEFAADRILPSDLTYLAFRPDSMPVRARHWGYYFMLVPDRGFWNDINALGIGPDAGSHWKQLYTESPPDAVLFSEKSGGLADVRDSLLHNQGIDISWLEDALRRDYVCSARLGISAYVRPEHMPRFAHAEWRRCAP